MASEKIPVFTTLYEASRELLGVPSGPTGHINPPLNMDILRKLVTRIHPDLIGSNQRGVMQKGNIFPPDPQPIKSPYHQPVVAISRRVNQQLFEQQLPDYPLLDHPLHNAFHHH